MSMSLELGSFKRLSLYVNNDYIGSFFNVRAFEHYMAKPKCTAIHISKINEIESIFCLNTDNCTYAITYKDDKYSPGHDLHINERL